ncbi:DUF2750 domain-containing protein [Hymenobacter lapidarius]|uniref:DUF2750 domain-containing protein n=1 Tax=Hymenobacter lapidarius TaxID=1908237 RepID=UPI0009F5D2AB|nr:DUF2750 domain-containing protein [Hymenobacter lapidarius]
MDYKPNQKEIASVSALKPFDRYQHMVKKVVDFEMAYTLTRADGTWALASVEGNTLVSIWPAAVYSELSAVGEWQEYVPHALSLHELMTTRLEAFEKNGFLINVFSINGKTGFVVNSNEFRADLEEESENY